MEVEESQEVASAIVLLDVRDVQNREELIPDMDSFRLHIEGLDILIACISNLYIT